ncbi:hypothetical protein B0H11DRAFT_1904030 [Mycena galericulata]|nr:hypothetical protein B0H11DRAFT_1904030 [Mycena galericulata]
MLMWATAMHDGRAQIKNALRGCKGLEGLGQGVEGVEALDSFEGIDRTGGTTGGQEAERRNMHCQSSPTWGTTGDGARRLFAELHKNIHDGSWDCPTRCSGDVSEPSSVEHSQPDLQARSTVRSLNHIKPNWWYRGDGHGLEPEVESFSQIISHFKEIQRLRNAAFDVRGICGIWASYRSKVGGCQMSAFPALTTSSKNNLVLPQSGLFYYEGGGVKNGGRVPPGGAGHGLTTNIVGPKLDLVGTRDRRQTWWWL